ncbi:MAG: YbhB/YbcL family Raf kinase inhibitor-like protein [Pseudomonadota bacterium]
MAFEFKSSAFANGAAIPAKYTCDGAEVSPPLAWSGAPQGTKSLALISDDPDAPAHIWVHWVMWNIPPALSGLKEGMEKGAALADGTRQGVNDSKGTGWGGPCPPSGTHRYFFKLYALDSILELKPDTTKAALETAMKGHILAQATLMGTYSRQR